MDQLLIPSGLAQRILDYLLTCPYKDVMTFIPTLAQLPSAEIAPAVVQQSKEE